MSRVGEAKNPGPCTQDGSIKVCITNPTALIGKVDQLLSLKASVYMLSETSCTQLAQKQIMSELRVKGFRTFFSAPVDSKKETVDGRPSLRGDASGTAVITSIPSQSFKGDIPAALLQSARISCSIIKLERFHILLVAIYGLPIGSCSNVKKANDLLLACVHQVVAQLRIPFLIAGDFNIDISTLPSFQLFKDIGAEEAFAFYQRTRNVDLGFTCRNATKNDTAILHPALLPFVVNMHIPDFKDFYPHVPLVIELQCKHHIEIPMRFDIPQSWSQFDIKRENLEVSYEHHSHCMDEVIQRIHDIQSGEDALRKWSHAVELAVNSALKDKRQDDPIKHPCKGLPASFKGRCQPRKLRAICPRKALPNDKHGGYNPDVEVTSEINIFKVRQTRRLQSLCNAVKGWNRDHPMPYSTQIQKEWERILRAPGYSQTWPRWVCTFPGVPPVSLHCPLWDDLSIFLQITKFDCDASCRHAAQQKKKAFQKFMQIDNADDFGRMTYKIMKETSSGQIHEIEDAIATDGILVRSTKGKSYIKLHQDVEVLQGFPATFGDCDIMIKGVEGKMINFNVVKGVIPCAGKFQQRRILTSPSDIGSKFANFWSKFWMRDLFEEQFSSDAWMDFTQMMDSIQFPDMQCTVKLDNVDTWMQIIKELPNKKAAGPCGWIYEELKVLPRLAIQHLVSIFVKIWPYGLSEEMMKSRAILLAKVEHPSKIEHTRPITILSCLYRLASKIVYTQVAAEWSKVLPISVSGGLPGRGVRDLSLQQSRIIEKAIGAKDKLCGSSMDLVKAFNLIPRWPIYALLNRLGIDRSILKFWLFSISRMSRYPSFRGHILQPVKAHTGLPEGDSWSVLGMISLSSLFWFKIANPKIQPFCYADNWSWIAKDTRAQFIAWRDTLNLIACVRMEISIDKSWVWALDKTQRNCLEQINLLFPHGVTEIQIIEHTRDLGEIVQYNRQWHSAPLIERIQEMCKRIRRVGSLPIAMDIKAKRIQTGAYPFGLYGVDNHYLGAKHFDDIRRAVFSAMVGSHSNASPLLACSFLTDCLHDPFLTVIISAFRNLRRLAARNLAEAQDMVNDVIKFRGNTPFGPASALAMYCKKLFLQIHEDGDVMYNQITLFNCFVTSAKDLKRKLNAHWIHLMPTLVKRKGIEQPMDQHVTLKALLDLAEVDRKLLALNVVGGFQSESTKSKWVNEHEAQCPLCQMTDSRKHRLTECIALAQVRQRNQEAVNILSNLRPQWVYHAIATEHPETELIANVLRSIADVQVTELIGPSCTKHIYFTDGSCLDADTPKLARSSWAVIRQNILHQDHLDADSLPIDYVEKLDFQCVIMGFTSGKQTIERAELSAVVKACQHAALDQQCTEVCIVTDSQYVIDVFAIISTSDWQTWAYRCTNFDLLVLLSHCKLSHDISFIKVKSHKSLQDANTLDEIRLITGNDLAVKAAALAMSKFPQEIQDSFSFLKDFAKTERHLLDTVFIYLIQLNKLRTELLSQNQTTAFSRAAPERCAITQAMGSDARDLMIKYFINIPLPSLPEHVDDEIFKANPLGARLGKAVFLWAKMLSWPSEDLRQSCDYENGIIGSWGISLLELLVNFVLVTGFYFPARLDGSAGNSRFVQYHSTEALLLSPGKRSVGNQIQSLQGCLASLASLLQIPLLPKYEKKGSTSLHRLHFPTHIHGFARRPVIPLPEATMQHVLTYVQSLGSSKAAFAPLPVFDAEPLFQTMLSFEEPSVKDRHRTYARLMMQRKRNR